jgi:hypothetical protein
MMKNTLIILLFIVSSSFSQMANGEASYSPKVSLTNTGLIFFTLETDLNSDGSNEVFKGSLIKLNNDEYWIQNTELKTSKGDYYSFGKKLLLNGKQVISQENADYGYVVVLHKGQDEIDVYIAGEYGNKNSDVLILSMK